MPVARSPWHNSRESTEQCCPHFVWFVLLVVGLLSFTTVFLLSWFLQLSPNYRLWDVCEEKRLSAIVCYSIVILLFQWSIDSCRSSHWSPPTLHDSEASQTESNQSIREWTFRYLATASERLRTHSCNHL